MALWYILCSFGTFFPVLVSCTNKNLAAPVNCRACNISRAKNQSLFVVFIVKKIDFLFIDSHSISLRIVPKSIYLQLHTENRPQLSKIKFSYQPSTSVTKNKLPLSRLGTLQFFFQKLPPIPWRDSISRPTHDP
jgi:hypothetical protein